MVATEMGEYVVGAWLREVRGCDFVDYNVRPPVTGLAGMVEFDVVGFHFGDGQAYLCEVATHLGGLNYGLRSTNSVQRIADKFDRQQRYAARYLTNFDLHTFMLWSPNVPKGKLTDGLAALEGLELVINQEYACRVDEVLSLARKSTRDTGNPFFRASQIISHLRR